MMDDATLLANALKFKEEGNEAFKIKSYNVAMGAYAKGIDHCERIKEESAESKNLLKTLLVNNSVCSNATNGFQDSVRNLGRAIEIDSSNAKAFFLRSTAYYNLKSYDEALSDIKQAVKLAPNDAKLRQEFERIKNVRAEHMKAEQNKYASFF